MGTNTWSRLSKGAVAACLILPLLTGCWDRQEIEERALVLAIGIDKASEEPKKQEESTHIRGKIAPKTEMIRISVQIAVPGRIPLGPGGGGGGVGGGTSRTVLVVDAEGRTIDDAINSLQQKVSPPLFFGHLRIIIVGEAIAKMGLQNLNDYFRRNPDVRRMNWMVISKGKASEIIRLTPQLERVPSLYLMTTMEQAVKMGRFPNDFLGIFWSASSARGKEGYLPYVEPMKTESIQIAGLAYFKGDTMIGTTSPLDVILLMGIAGMNPAGGVVYTKLPGTNDYLEFSPSTRKTATHVRIENGHPRISLKVVIEGNIREKSNEQISLSPEVISQIEQELSKNAKKLYVEFIKKTQDKNSDIFGFGEYIRAKQPKYWNVNIQSKENWQQAYKDLPVDITIQFHIRRVGMKAN
jgi:spore germination protein KC